MYKVRSIGHGTDAPLVMSKSSTARTKFNYDTVGRTRYNAQRHVRIQATIHGEIYRYNAT
jgi:hypothetical protein